MKSLFKQQSSDLDSQNLTQSTRHWEITYDESDWQNSETIKHFVQIQNKLIREKRFDPFHYFGGFRSRDVETGIIRKNNEICFC